MDKQTDSSPLQVAVETHRQTDSPAESRVESTAAHPHGFLITDSLQFFLAGALRHEKYQFKWHEINYDGELTLSAEWRSARKSEFLPRSSSLTSLDAFSPSRRSSWSIFLDLSAASFSSVLTAQPIFEKINSRRFSREKKRSRNHFTT